MKWMDWLIVLLLVVVGVFCLTMSATWMIGPDSIHSYAFLPMSAVFSRHMFSNSVNNHDKEKSPISRDFFVDRTPTSFSVPFPSSFLPYAYLFR